jgi:hypothetical protein
VDEVGGVGAGRGVGVLADGEVVEVVDQSGEDCRIIGGEVEGSRVRLLHDDGMLEYCTVLQSGTR